MTNIHTLAIFWLYLVSTSLVYLALEEKDFHKNDWTRIIPYALLTFS